MKNSTLIAFGLGALAFVGLAILTAGSDDDLPPPPPAAQLAQRDADDPQLSEPPEEEPQEQVAEPAAPVQAPPAESKTEPLPKTAPTTPGLTGGIGGFMDDTPATPERERRDEQSWTTRYKAADEALVEQVPGLTPRQEHDMREVLRSFRDARQRILGDLRAKRIDRGTMRERARDAKRARDQGLLNVLTPAQYAGLDFDDAQFRASR